MAISMSPKLLVLLVVSVLFVAGAQAAVSEFPPPAARRAGPVSPPATSTEEDKCPMIQVPSLIDACRYGHPNGPVSCTAQCLALNYIGGYCDILPSGRLGDCNCLKCLPGQDE